VSTQLLAAIYALPCYAALYPTPSQSYPALFVVVGFVRRAELLGTPPWPAPTGTLDGLYGIEESFEDHRVVDVCGTEHYREWDIPSVRNKVALGALLCFFRRICCGFWAPFRQGKYESTKTREVCFRALLNDSDAELSLSIV
jgi:hypothetical protein